MSLVALKPLSKGATSYNFCVETAQEKFLVKIYLYQVDTLLSILKALKKEQPFLKIPSVKEFNNQSVFQWGEYKLIVLSYAEGKTIPSWKLRGIHLGQIFKEYNLLWSALQSLKEEAVPKVQFMTMYDETQLLLQKRIDNSRGVVRYMFCKLKAQFLPPPRIKKIQRLFL